MIEGACRAKFDEEKLIQKLEQVIKNLRDIHRLKKKQQPVQLASIINDLMKTVPDCTSFQEAIEIENEDD